MGFTIEFTPFQVDSMAQLTTTAFVRQAGEVLWTEPIVLTLVGATTPEQVQELLAQRTAGFAARVDAITAAKQFAGITPQIISV